MTIEILTVFSMNMYVAQRTWSAQQYVCKEEKLVAMKM